MNHQQTTKRLLQLQELLYQFLCIERMIHMPDSTGTDRRETDTEHSYHLAILAWYLTGAYPHLDKNKVIRYALVHDIVEVHAGDVMAIGRTKQEQDAKELKEKEALVKLKKDWPDFTDLTGTIEEYEEQNSPEAVFVKALDKLTPLLHNLHSNGKTWKKYDMKRQVVVANKDEKTANSPEVNALWKVLREEIMTNDDYFNEGSV